MSKPDILRQLFPDLPAPRFRENWPRKAVQFHGPLRRIELLAALGGKPVAYYARTHRRPLRLMIQRRGGQDYDERVTPDVEIALRAYEAGATLCLQSFEKHCPIVAAVIPHLSKRLAIPSEYISANVYASKTGSLGLPLHFDAHEVIVVQLRGQKVWRIASNTAVSFPKENYVPVAAPTPEVIAAYGSRLPLKLPRRMARVVMRPGSVLYMPRGHWHTTSTSRSSIAVTFGFRFPSWSDVISRAVLARLDRYDEGRIPLFDLWRGTPPGREAAHLLSSLAARLARDLPELRAEQVLEDFTVKDRLVRD